MASIQNDIRAALESKLSSTSGLPPIAYENVAFVPTTGTSFLKVQYLPTVTRPAARGLNPQLRYQGVFSVTAYTPEGRGPATADISFTNADAETITVSIDYAERQQGMVDSPWYFTPINIGWYIYN